jgi:ubiquinone/menaquinone biosynthesis C-methylase UbiE
MRSVDGVDLSPAYIRHASHRARHARPRFQTGDACALPFPDASFDHALSSLVLQFIPDANRAVREMKRVTRCRGTVAAATWDTQNQVIHQIFFETAAQLDPKARELRIAACTRPMARADGLVDAWRDAGLQDVVLDALTISMDFASFLDFWTPFEGQDGPYAQYFGTLQAAQKEKLRKMVEAVYLNGDPDGPRSYPAKAWAVKGAVPDTRR